MFLVFLCVILILFYSYVLFTRPVFTRRRLPPGPYGLPILGCIPYITPATAHLTVESWCRRYGGLLSFYMGRTLVVVLGDSEIVREAFLKNGDAFNGRCVIRAFRAKGVDQGIGLTGAEGDLWREQRRFCMKTLKDFGAGRSVLEPKIRREAQFLCDEVSKREGRPLEITSYVHYAVANIIVEFVFGRRFDYDDALFIDYLSTITYRLSTSGVNGFSAFNFLPWLLNLPGQRNAKRVVADGAKVLAFLRRCIKEKCAQFEHSDGDDDKLSLDYVNAFLKAAAAGDGQYFHDDQLLIAVQQLFIAGSETTATTLRWLIWHLCRYPDCQEKIFEEIKCVSGESCERSLSWGDRLQTPYTEATICEAERIYPVFPFSVTHRTLTDTSLRGYHIPKESYVIPLIWAVHRDPAHFPNPDQFRPERFLGSDGKLMKNPSFMPFGVGPRVCLGESLARMEVFLFLTALVQRFRFRFSSTSFEMRPRHLLLVGVVMSPAPFDIIAEERRGDEYKGTQGPSFQD